MPLWSRYFPLVLGLCGVLLARPAAADLPTRYGYEVRVDGQMVTSALTYHSDTVLRGKDPESGVTYVLQSPEWTGLEIDGATYTFHIEPPGARFYPFEPTWVVRLQDVRFSVPPVAKPSPVCRERPAHVILKTNPKALDCSMTAAERKKIMKQIEDCDDCDACSVVYERRYRECPALFPKTEPAQHYVTLDDIKGLPFVRIDVSAARKVVQRCQQGNTEACEQVYQRYTRIQPGREDSLCEFQMAGEPWGSAPYAADEQECLFHAYYARLKEDCGTRKCEVKYRWGGQQGQPVQNPAWKPVPLPPPLDQHARLFPVKPAHVSFKQIVQRCQQQDRDACLRVSGGYNGLPRPENKANCYMEVNGKRSFDWATGDAEECAFNAYYKALESGCRLPGCTVKYLWQAKRTLSDSETQEKWPTEGWQVMTAPPPIDKHERLMSANNW